MLLSARPELLLDERTARYALRARVLGLVSLDVGADADLRGAGRDMEVVEDEALLEVRLDKLAAIVDRVMTTVDRSKRGNGADSAGHRSGDRA